MNMHMLVPIVLDHPSSPCGYFRRTDRLPNHPCILFFTSFGIVCCFVLYDKLVPVVFSFLFAFFLVAQERCRAVPPWDADLSEMREVVETFEARDYKPPVWARNAHLHTIVASGDMEKKLLGDRIVSESFHKLMYSSSSIGTCVHIPHTQF